MTSRAERLEQSEGQTALGAQDAGGEPAAACAWKARLVRWSPALVGLALAGAGFGAMGLAANQLTVTVAPPEEPATGPEPLDLLRDDVSTLQTDVSRLGTGMGDALQQLGSGLDGQAAGRAEALGKQVAALERRLASLERTQKLTLEAVQQLERQGPVTAKAQPAAEAAGEAAAAAEERQPELAEEPAPEAPAPAAKRGLFSFRLGGGLDFDQRLRFEVIPSLSRVGFDAKSTLHDFTGVTSKVHGWFASRLTHADEGSEGLVAAAAGDLETGVEGRDENMLELLETAKHPEIRFALTGFETEAVDAEARTLRGKALGTMTIRGTERPLRVPVTIEVDPSRRLVLAGEVLVKLTDFGIEPPTVAGGAISVEDEIKLWLSLRLRSLGKAATQ